MSSPGGTFWGLIVKPNKRYDTVVKESFRVCKACIEPASAGDKVTSLMAEYDGEEYIIANLNKKHLNEQLDLAFSIGEKMAFKVDGPGTVHLTGNILEDDDDFMDPEMMMGEEEESEEEDVEEAIGNALKRKKGDVNDQVKKMKLALMNGKTGAEEDSSDDDDDDSDDSDEMDTTAGDLDSTTNFAEEEDSDDDDDDSEDGEDDDDDSDEEPPAPKKSPLKEVKPTNGQPKINGAGDKTPKSKQAEANVKTPKAEPKTPKSENKTPKAAKPEIKTPKPESKTPKQEAKTPKDTKTPNKNDALKTPAKTPKAGGDKSVIDTPKSARKTVKGGIHIEDLKEGTGPECKPGQNVGMYYVGRLATNKKQFDACQSGKPFKFRLGKGEVIKGWDVGLAGMKVGGKRKLTIPPNMAYGAAGAPPDIPPNSTLVFDVECKYVN
ncbi:46 kDa FK506-binding nuclear protein-like [Eurytemora carolleeae]|uniref:46 kDa FK506-binding nuclear protein-like n=1 Tax=Eurytemora carolleeae TaxID=1294199 RepID=UPI000C767739|nr:46 kDa FK506-binding nuclear protein-like [Eurytemora carolleeae]|eukprot:XP_023327565.1 46 kDa FK506-binding nuclear protein-like [Eurytemora affinis]